MWKNLDNQEKILVLIIICMVLIGLVKHYNL